MVLILTETARNTSRDRLTANWRMLVDFDVPGVDNMAVDEVLLDSVIAGGAPAIRFYTWRPATLSLGVNQAVGEVDLEGCARRGFGLVRRLTGGRAVLHQHELTYSVIAREADQRVSGGVIESYRKISEALVAGLSALGVPVTLSEPDRAMFRAMAAERRYDNLSELEQSSHGAACFDTASAYELTAGGRKLAGSAQARRGGALLQHGSILLDVDWEAWASVFAYATESGRARARQRLPQRMTSLKEQLGRQISPEEVRSALADSFATGFNIKPHISGLSDDEKLRARSLVNEKYGHDSWTLRR